MNKPHKHAALIHAYADGAELQRKIGQRWIDVPHPHFYDIEEYRIKPRTVKREGWVNIGKHYSGFIAESCGEIFDSREAAEAGASRIETITAKVEWEEEE